MNSTQWATLTEFVKYLGQTGKCKVEETPKGWFMTYIDRDSETLFKEKMKNKRLKADIVEEEKMEREIQRQIERAEQMEANDKGGEEEGVTKSRMLEKNDEEGAKIKLSLGQAKKNVEMNGSSRLVFDEVEPESSSGKRRREGESSGKNKSVLDELMKEEEKAKERINRKDYWLCPGIVVKVMSKALADKGYYKQKGVVRKVIDKYCGEIEMFENKHVLRVDQDELETVLPQIGGIVKIVNGAYRGEIARLLAIDADNFCAKVQIEKGIYDGRVLKAVEYEDICKLA